MRGRKTKKLGERRDAGSERKISNEVMRKKKEERKGRKGKSEERERGICDKRKKEGEKIKEKDRRTRGKTK